MTASILARAARAASGLSLSALAQRSHVSEAELALIEQGRREPTFAALEKILLSNRRLVVSIPTVRGDAARIAAEISAILESGTVLAGRTHAGGSPVNSNTARAFRRFIQLADNLAAERGATRVGLTLTEPVPTGSAQWDAAIAALCEYRLNADALPIPEWISTRIGNSGSPWAPRSTVYDIPVDLAQVPPEFLRRGILIEAPTLASV